MTAFDTLMAPFAPAARRYSIEQHGTTTHYGPWRIHYDPPPIPVRTCDWHYVHDNSDGERGGSCASFADALNECDDLEDDQ